MSLSTWNSHSPCVRYFLNLPQGVCAIQMELPPILQVDLLSPCVNLNPKKCIYAGMQKNKQTKTKNKQKQTINKTKQKYCMHAKLPRDSNDVTRHETRVQPKRRQRPKKDEKNH